MPATHVQLEAGPLNELKAGSLKVDSQRFPVATRDSSLSVATRVIRSQRTWVLQSTLVILLAIAASAASTCCIIWTRPTHVSGGVLVDTNESPVATATAQIVVSLPDLPQLGEEFDYHTVEKVTLKVADRETNETKIVGLRAVGYAWLNDTDMDLFLADEVTLHISQTNMVLAPTVTVAGSTPVDLRRRRLQDIDATDVGFMLSMAAMVALGFGASTVVVTGLVVCAVVAAGIATYNYITEEEDERRRKLLEMRHPLMSEARLAQAAALAASFAMHHASRDLLGGPMPNFFPPGSLSPAIQ